MPAIDLADTVSPMDTHLAATFLTVARTGSFTLAAFELHLAQSTVTAQIKTLESELGTVLLDRTPSGARLSETGLRVHRCAQDLLAAEEAMREAAMPPTALSGTVAVGATESLCAYLLPTALASLQERHPGVNVKLLPMGGREGRGALREGRVDLLLLLEPQGDETGLTSEILRSVDLVYVRAAGGAELTRQGFNWTTARGQRWFLLEEGCHHSDEVARLLRGTAGRSGAVTRLGSVEAVRACVTEGLGVAVLPEFAVAGHLDRLTATSFPHVKTSIILAMPSNRSSGLLVRAVAAQLRATTTSA